MINTHTYLIKVRVSQLYTHSHSNTRSHSKTNIHSQTHTLYTYTHTFTQIHIYTNINTHSHKHTHTHTWESAVGIFHIRYAKHMEIQWLAMALKSNTWKLKVQVLLVHCFDNLYILTMTFSLEETNGHLNS